MRARAKTPGYRALACIEAVRPVQLMLGNGSGADRPNSHCDQMMMRRRRYFTSVNQSSGPDGTRKGTPVEGKVPRRRIRCLRWTRGLRSRLAFIATASTQEKRKDKTMKGKRMPAKELCNVVVCTVLAGTASLGVATTASAAATSNGLPQLAYKGTITFDAGSYTPPLAGIKPTPGAATDTEMQAAANAFHQMYPGITIKFVPTSASIGTNEWYLTEAAAGSLPDVVNVPGYYVNISLPVGLFQNLSPYFAKPNPFIPGNTSWLSTMDPAAVLGDTVPGNTPGTSGVFIVNGDYGGIGFFYNKNLFKEAGITSVPVSWNQLIADSQQIDTRLKSKGVYAGASYAPVIYNWWAHLFVSNYLGAAEDKLLNSTPPTFGIGAVGYFYSHDGSIINPSVNPREYAWFPSSKDLMVTWDPKDIDVPENTNEPGVDNTEFLGQQVAYDFTSGYHLLRQVAALPKSQQFPIGYFEITNLLGTSKYATNLQTWQNNGGPAVGFQFGISAPKSNRLMTPALTAASVAWLQFISSPKWDSLIVNNEGSAIPIIKGATTEGPLQPLLKQIDAVAPITFGTDMFDGLTDNSFDEIDGLYLQYVDGYTSLTKAESEFKSDVASVMKTFDAQNSVVIAKATAYWNKKLGMK